MRAAGLAVGLAAAALVLAGPSFAHDGVNHATQAEAAAHAAAVPTGPALPLPFDLGGPFVLTDHTGAARNQVDPPGRMQLVFFGYANCPSICSAAMPMIADTVDILAGQGIAAVPVMITVDPARDTPETMAEPLHQVHPDFIGLTGTEAELAQVRALFGVQSKVVFTDPEYGAVFAHGSHIYLLDGAGEMLTLIPPILSADRAAEIAARYADGV